MYLIESLVDEFKDLSDRVFGRESTIGVPISGKPEIQVAGSDDVIVPNRISFKLNRDRSIHTVYICGLIVGRGGWETTHQCTLAEAPEWVRAEFTEAA